MIERLTEDKIVDWLNQNYLYNGEAFLFVTDPPVTPEGPESLGVVTPITGRGFLYEKTFEHQGFQLRIRSPQNVPHIARQVSMEVDKLLNCLQMPWDVDNAKVIELGWMGGGPAPLTTANRSNYRYSWVCSYYYISATGF